MSSSDVDNEHHHQQQQQQQLQQHHQNQYQHQDFQIRDGDDDEYDDENFRRRKCGSRYCAGLTMKIIFSTPGLVILVVCYSIIGALIFPILEAPMDLRDAVSIAKSRDDCLKELWIITERLNVLYERNWTLLVHEQLRRFEGTIVAATKSGFIETMGEHFPRWSFSEALLYSVTVITTIGHGNLTPRTAEGKIVTMVYAIIGVPLMLMCLSSLGGLLANALQCTYSRLCRSRRRGSSQMESDSHEQFEEVDCNVCKYDTVQNEIKHQSYDKYIPVSNRDDSCRLIRNSPVKQKLGGTVIQTTANNMNYDKSNKRKKNQQQDMMGRCEMGGNGGSSASSGVSAGTGGEKCFIKNCKSDNAYYQSSTTGGCCGSMSTAVVGGGGGGGIGSGGGSIVGIVGGGILQCHPHQSPTKYPPNNTILLGNHLNSSINERNNHLVVYHTATVHGLGRSKFIPKPLPQEINMILAECDLNNMQQSKLQQQHSHQDNNFINKNHCIGEGDNDDDDEDEDDDHRIGCQHDTPSRIPLISSKQIESSNLDHEMQILNGSNNLEHHRRHHRDDTEHEMDSMAVDRRDHHLENNSPPQVPITIILIILISYISLGTVIFSFWENWSIIDGAYFCFVTLSTIGFGDILPLKTFRGPELQLFACCAYLMLGLVLVAMSFSLLETQLLWKCRRMAVRLKLAKD